MKFDIEKLKKIARPMTEIERQEIEIRDINREWLAMSAKFALLVRNILRRENVTQKELANRMEVSCSQISKILSGKENLSLQTIVKVEKALGINLIVFNDLPFRLNEPFQQKQYPIAVCDTLESGSYYASEGEEDFGIEN